MVFCLAFDLMLAQAPIRDGAVQIQESRLAVADPDDPASACRHAAVRAALLNRYGSGFRSPAQGGCDGIAPTSPTHSVAAAIASSGPPTRYPAASASPAPVESTAATDGAG
jgi:hypothetical protein